GPRRLRPQEGPRAGAVRTAGGAARRRAARAPRRRRRPGGRGAGLAVLATVTEPAASAQAGEVRGTRRESRTWEYWHRPVSSMAGGETKRPHRRTQQPARSTRWSARTPSPRSRRGAPPTPWWIGRAH